MASPTLDQSFNQTDPPMQLHVSVPFYKRAGKAPRPRISGAVSLDIPIDPV